MKKQTLITVLVLLALGLCIYSFSRLLSSKIRNCLYEEHRIVLNELTSHMAHSITNTIQDGWNLSTLLSNILAEEDHSNLNILELSEYIGKLIGRGDAIFVLYDINGHCYSSDGRMKHAEQMKLLMNPQVQQLHISQYARKEREANYVFFITRLERPLQISSGANTETITHFSIGLNIDFVLSRFMSSFKDRINTFIIDDTGLMLYKGYDIGTLIQGSNYFTKLRKHVSFPHGEAAEKIIGETRKGNVQCHEAIVNSSGISTYCCMKKIEETQWIIACTIPSKILGTGSAGYLKQLIIYVAVLFFFLSIVCVIVIGTMQQSKNSRILLQKESNLNSHLREVAAAQEELLQKQKETNVLLEEAAAKAREASEAKTVFLSNMSHDIRTPINGIMGMTAIAMKEKDRLTAKAVDCLNKIQGASEHLLSLVNDVLELSRIESGKTKFTLASMDLPELLGNCTNIIQGQIGERSLNLTGDFAALKHHHVLGDSLHLRQIFINILGNAVKFTPDGGSIIFSASELECIGSTVTCRFVIKDTGIGMKEEFLEHIFEAFSQAEEGARSQYKGTGLGMSIVKKFVEMQNGTIEVQSTYGNGSTFIVTMPFELDEAPVQEAGIEAAEQQPGSLAGARVLLVEDNMLNQEIAQELLEDEGMEVTVASDGAEALEIFKASAPGEFSFILMDVMMPVMNGLDATRAIRALERPDVQSIPIIAMTANAFEEDMQKTREAGMNAHLSKPINLKLVLDVLKKFRHRN